MAIACVDWRQADTRDLATLYAAEIGRWSAALGWDTASSWDHIELGRRLGTVPGLLAIDADGRIVGWTFYILHREALQIGGFAATSESVTAALLDGILLSEAAALAQSVTFFAFTDAPGLTGALARRGLTVGSYEYLIKPLRGERGPRCPEARAWRAGDAAAMVALLATAYPEVDEARPFAPHGTAEAWRDYVGQLIEQAGCGTMMPDSCFVVPSGLDRIAGVVLVTRLAAATAHIAQIVVEPQSQRRGLGRLLVNTACVSASDAGCDRITLLVHGRNTWARRLYEASGFVPATRFVSAGSCQPVRLTSVAAAGDTISRP